MLNDILPATYRNCPKCQGLLMFGSDHYGPYFQCTRCGKHIDLLAPHTQQQLMEMAQAQTGQTDPDASLLQPTKSNCNEAEYCLNCQLPFCKHDNRKEYDVLRAQRALTRETTLNTPSNLRAKQAASQIGVTNVAYAEALRRLKQPKQTRPANTRSQHPAPKFMPPPNWRIQKLIRP